MRILTPRLLSGLAATTLLAACGGGESGTSSLSLYLTDAPLDGASKVWLQFTGVEVKPAGGQAETFLFSAPKGFDMLTLQHGNAAELLGNTTVPSGNYEWVRLILDPAADSSYVVDNSGTHGLRIPSGMQTGLKLIRGFTMPDGGHADFTIDFQLDKSIHAPPGQSPNYLMKPVLRMTNNVETGMLEGTFAPATLAAIPACTGKAPVVYLYTGASITPDDIYNPVDDNAPPDSAPLVDPLVTASAYLTAQNTYAYRFGFVQTGSYTVAFTCGNDDPAVDEDAALLFTTPAKNVAVTAGQLSTVNF